jgi:phospholipid-translocating ATPase
MFWYLYWKTFDATYLYEYTFILLYNLVLPRCPSSFPEARCLLSWWTATDYRPALDQDINARASLAFPQLYVRGIRGLEYTKTRFWLFMLDGLYQSVVVYFIPSLAFSNGLSTSWPGKGLDSLADLGTTVAVAAIFSANIFVGLNTKYWTFLRFIIIIGSMLSTIVWISLYSYMPSIQSREEIVVLFSTVSFWTTIVLSIILAVSE